MFFKKRKCVNDSVAVDLGSSMLFVTNVEADKIEKEVQRRLESRLAHEKAKAEFESAPEYRITQTYDIGKNLDMFHLQQKHFFHGLVIQHNLYITIYSGTKKEVEARFARVMPKKGHKKAA